MLPTLLLSGFVFPISSMPLALQWITGVVPARYFLAALREIVLKGAGIDVWWTHAAALVVLGALGLAAGTVRMLRSL
jgi:ABC-2 type transport system permease protein